MQDDTSKSSHQSVANPVINQLPIQSSISCQSTLRARSEQFQLKFDESYRIPINQIPIVGSDPITTRFYEDPVRFHRILSEFDKIRIKIR